MLSAPLPDTWMKARPWNIMFSIVRRKVQGTNSLSRHCRSDELVIWKFRSLRSKCNHFRRKSVIKSPFSEEKLYETKMYRISEKPCKIRQKGRSDQPIRPSKNQVRLQGLEARYMLKNVERRAFLAHRHLKKCNHTAKCNHLRLLLNNYKNTDV